MTILWSILIAIITSFVTTLVFNFFLHRMTENAKKPWMTQGHQRIIDLLSHPNAIATVQLPNAAHQNYQVRIMPIDYLMAGVPGDEQLQAFDEMMEQRIVLPVSELQHRLSHNYKEKYRKHLLALAYEEFGIKAIVGSLRQVVHLRKR